MFRNFPLARASFVGAAIVSMLPGSANAAIYSFANSVGASNTFSIVNSSAANTATFSSTAGPGTFYVANSGLFTFGLGLGDYQSFSGDPLTITFANPVTVGAIYIPFGLEDAFGTFGSDTLTATASNGQLVVASTTLNNSFFPEPQGALYLQPTSPISSLTLTSANPFAIASVQVPEPMSLSLLGVGLAGLAAARRRRRTA